MDQATNLRNMIRQHELSMQQNDAKRHAKIITVTSGKGGVGKSNVSINLGIALQELGNRVIILDADFGLANIEVMLGIRPRYSLYDLIFQKKDIQEIITEGPEGLGFISGGSGIEELTKLDSFQIQTIAEQLGKLDELADYIIIDTGAGISEALMQFVAASDKVLLVVTPEPTSITDGYAVLKAISRNFQEEENIPGVDLIANRVSSPEEGKILFMKLNVVARKFLRVDFQLMGPVMQDMSIQKAVMAQKPLMLLQPKAPAAVSIMKIAKAIHEGSIVELNSPKKGIRQLFRSFIK